jgi:pterin-4a-carbinolamine dehydratase
MKTLYFLNQREPLRESQFVPIRPKETQWVLEKAPNRMTRRYHFETYDQLVFYVTNLLRYANQINHFPDLEIGYDTVLVTTYTHSLQDVTEQDTRMTRISDQIFKDAKYVPPEDPESDEQEEEEEDVDNDERLAEGYRFDWTADW